MPTESIIQLPTGPAVPIPKIQFKFNDETPSEKINREKRLSQVKQEFQKAWKGYREKAWLHDEVSPVSGGFRDPFCGWAATLVDGLDTLYIMGMEMEFEEAVKAVGKLDFTTSPRNDIPMFETTIRYLGGLVAAYDVSGQKHKILLDKAVELGNVLMGAFDTPNRERNFLVFPFPLHLYTVSMSVTQQCASAFMTFNEVDVCSYHTRNRIGGLGFQHTKC